MTDKLLQEKHAVLHDCNLSQPQLRDTGAVAPLGDSQSRSDAPDDSQNGPSTQEHEEVLELRHAAYILCSLNRSR